MNYPYIIFVQWRVEGIGPGWNPIQWLLLRTTKVPVCSYLSGALKLLNLYWQLLTALCDRPQITTNALSDAPVHCVPPMHHNVCLRHTYMHCHLPWIASLLAYREQQKNLNVIHHNQVNKYLLSKPSWCIHNPFTLMLGLGYGGTEMQQMEGFRHQLGRDWACSWVRYAKPDPRGEGETRATDWRSLYYHLHEPGSRAVDNGRIWRTLHPCMHQGRVEIGTERKTATAVVK